MGSEWVLALEQNRELQVTRGTLAATAEAVRSGADLRLFLIARGYEETLYFQQTYAGENNAFAGLMTHHHFGHGAVLECVGAQEGANRADESRE